MLATIDQAIGILISRSRSMAEETTATLGAISRSRSTGLALGAGQIVDGAARRAAASYHQA